MSSCAGQRTAVGTESDNPGSDMNELFALIRVSDSDAEAFLQGQLTQDVRKLAQAPLLLAAWCNAKGRVICVMRLVAMDDAIGLIVPRSMSEAVVRRLSLFRLRAKVRFDIAGPEWQATAIAAEEDLAILDAAGLLPNVDDSAVRRKNQLVAFDTGGTTRCIEIFGPAQAFRSGRLGFRRALDDSAWRAALITAGIPTITEETSEQYTPHMLNLDLLGAISFSKGCYTGQEVVARTEHLGKAKRRLFHYQLASGSALIGDKLARDGQDVGEIVDVSGREVLAIVPVDLCDKTLRIGTRDAHPVALPKFRNRLPD